MPIRLENDLAQVWKVFDTCYFVGVSDVRWILPETYKYWKVTRIPLIDDVRSDLHDLIIGACTMGGVSGIPVLRLCSNKRASVRDVSA